MASLLRETFHAHKQNNYKNSKSYDLEKKQVYLDTRYTVVTFFSNVFRALFLLTFSMQDSSKTLVQNSSTTKMDCDPHKLENVILIAQAECIVQYFLSKTPHILTYHFERTKTLF